MKSISALNFSTPALCLVLSAVAALSASARTVYDAGKALKANCTSGGYANPYTDANGGIWSYNLSDNVGNPKNVTLDTGARDYNSGSIAGFAVTTANKGRSIRVNVSDHTISTGSAGSEPLGVDELFMFPGAYSNECSHVRFTAPVAGWYSAFVSAHDLVRGTVNNDAGVELRVLAQGNLLVSGIVSLEDKATRRMDFQMPVRHLAAGETIDVLVGWNNDNNNDDTGVKFIVTKEDEGAFYDSGIAMTNCVANVATYGTPYGTIKDGTWYFLKTTVPSSDVDFAAWAPANFGHSSGSRISVNATRSGLKGFGNNASGQSPYVVVNSAASVSSDNTAPCELQAHPYGNDARIWTTIRFRPPVSGYYSGSVVARDVNKGSGSGVNGVDVYLLVSENVVTNAYISAETYSSTTHLEFDSRLMVAGEPVDIVISSHGQASSDATGISAIFRRADGTVYDAGKSYYDEHVARRCSNYYDDTLDANAKWLVAESPSPWAPVFNPLSSYLEPAGDKLSWWTHAVNTANNGTAPRFAMAANGIASVDNLYLNSGAPLLATTPYELNVQPNNPGSAGAPNYVAALKAEVPSDGLYRVRSYVRDLNNNVTEGDGVLAVISVNGQSPASAIVSRDSNDFLYEAALSAERLWIRQGEHLAVGVDSRTGSTSDATGLTACYERMGDATARVINIDITGSDENYVGVGREGWSDWTRWNGIRFSSKLPAVAERTRLNCREADGTTKRNVAFTLKRDSDANIEKGWSPTGYTGPTLLRIWAKSTGPSDTYTFTLSKLKKNEPYTLYLYSSKGMDSGNAVDGNAVFTVGGVTKSADETWNLQDAKVVARFDVTSDANGEISGTFAAGSVDTSSQADSLKGGAFNGLTLVGQFPDYVPMGTSVILR